MKAIIPAAGIGKRLRPHTLLVPKVMINLAGKPIIGHIIDAISKAGVTQLEIIVGYKNDQVEQYVVKNYGDLHPGFPLQRERKGLGHAVLQGLDDSDEPALIILGDTIFDLDFTKFLNLTHTTLAVVPVEDPRRFGVAETQGDVVMRLVEKPENPQSNLALVGLYYIKNQGRLKRAIEQIINENITTKGEYQLTDALQVMIADGEEVHTKAISGWYDCGTKESLLSSHQFLLTSIQTRDELPHVIQHPPVYIHPDADVKNSVIGPNVTIARDAVVRNAVLTNVIVGRYATVENVVLKDSLIGDSAVVQESARVLNIGDFSELKFY
ncbi:MAG: NTP transferase domain-containing protein [Candidatus Marinimicrobia bacterium]|nr:NTP transferase domain-containing protein [Candidatus Neomarinimicrobiota bacterium]MCF7839397.1 NTP transferase domain-containing protein [Candidatus Neomarinimicrobiota bacterium]MCF7903320.1 NTP transferase domain-containing protein [Candidatus Neomarinimicrobiota bacterium]